MVVLKVNIMALLMVHLTVPRANTMGVLMVHLTVPKVNIMVLLMVLKMLRNTTAHLTVLLTVRKESIVVLLMAHHTVPKENIMALHMAPLGSFRNTIVLRTVLHQTTTGLLTALLKASHPLLQDLTVLPMDLLDMQSLDFEDDAVSSTNYHCL